MPYPSGTTYPSGSTYPGDPNAATQVPRAGRWTFVATDRNGNELGEVQGAMARSVTPRPLKALGTASLKIRVDHPLLGYFADGEKTRLKVYEEQTDGVKRLRFNGATTSFEATHGSDGQDSVTLGFTSGGYFLFDRFVGKSRTGFVQGAAASQIDRGTIMFNALDDVNAEGRTGVRKGSRTDSTSTYIPSGTAIFKPVLELFDDMAGPYGGPDYEFEPIEPKPNGGDIARLNIAAAIGSTRNDAVFEFGRGKNNVKTWRWVIDPKTVANKAWHLPVGYPDNTSGSPVSYTDATSVADRGLHEALVAADISEDSTRALLVQEHVQIRKVPKQVIVFEPRMETAGDLRYRVDYQEGDVVPFSAWQRYPRSDSTGASLSGNTEGLLVDAYFRIRAVTFNLNENGDATPLFTLTAEDTG